MFARLPLRITDVCKPGVELTNLLLVAIVMSLGLFAGMLAFLEIGYCLSRPSSRRHPEVTHEGIGVVEAAVFALLGLLLGFSFADGTSRLEARRQLIVQETNAISTAYDRLDLLPASDQPAMRHLFREYLDARLRVYAKLPDLKAVDHAAAIAVTLYAILDLDYPRSGLIKIDTADQLLLRLRDSIQWATLRYARCQTHRNSNLDSGKSTRFFEPS